MTLNQMEYFIVTAQERSFTKAAKKLFLTQQSLSASISSLEAELHCALFLRKMPLELTYAGNRFLTYALDLRHRVQVMEHEFQDISRNQKGLLRIAIASTRGHAILPPVVAEFHRQFPGIQLAFIEDANSLLLSHVQHNEADLAIGNFESEQKGLLFQDFFEEEVALFASNAFLETIFPAPDSSPAPVQRPSLDQLKELPSLPFLMANPEDIAGKIGYQVLETFRYSPRIPVTINNLETLLAFCVNGLGLCFSPVNLAKSTLTKEEYLSLHKFSLGELGRYPIRFAYRSHDQLWSVLFSFMDLASQNIRSL